MGQSLILFYCVIPSFEVSGGETSLPRCDVMLENVFLGVPLESQMVSVWVGANREDLVWEDRNREEGGMPSVSLLESTVWELLSQLSLCLSPSAAGGLHTWGTPSPPVSCPGRNSETFLHATRHRMPSFTHAGKHECISTQNAHCRWCTCRWPYRLTGLQLIITFTFK